MAKLNPKLSVIIPIHDMKGGAEFLWRSINMLTEQTFQDFEIIITKAGKMAENTNAGIKKARGELVKILYLDDMLAHKDALQNIVNEFKPEDEWMISGCSTNVSPYYTGDIHTGNNKLGSPSCLTFRNRFEDNMLFDEQMSWLLDCDLYKRLYEKYSYPRILNRIDIIIGIHDGQMTNILTDAEKKAEEDYMLIKTNK